MKSILEEMWYGNIGPSEDCHKPTEEIQALTRHVADHHERLQSTLAEEQRDVLRKLDDCRAELNGITDREIFIYAFRLGAQTAMEIMSARTD